MGWYQMNPTLLLRAIAVLECKVLHNTLRLIGPSSTPIRMNESKSFLLESCPNEKRNGVPLLDRRYNRFPSSERRPIHLFSNAVGDIVVLKPVAATRCPEITR